MTRLPGLSLRTPRSNPAAAPEIRVAHTLTEADSVILEKIYGQHCLIAVSFADDEAAYQSAIIELVPEQSYFVLDALTPASGNARARALPAIELRTRLDGVDIRFGSHILRSGGDRTAPYFKVAYPTSISYPQRRSEYRVTVPLDTAVAMQFSCADGFSLRGEIRDLSPSGFSARLTGGDLDQLNDGGGRQGQCEIKFGDGEQIKATIEICHVFPSRGRSAPRIGACFVDLDAPTERALERYVARLERAQARLR